MKRVTRDIDPAAARDLLERVPRACISTSGPRGPLAQPVALLWREGRYFVGIPQSAGLPPAAGQELVLLVDEGMQFYDLRAIYIRGYAQHSAPPPNAPAGHAWIELLPSKTVAWDYGTLHEVDDDDPEA